MVTLLLSVIPIACLLAAFAYAAVAGAKLHGSNGFLSVLGVAFTLVGLTLGRLLDRFTPTPRVMDDWLNYRGQVDYEVSSRGDRYLAVLSVEVAVLFIFAAALSTLAVVLIKRDAAGGSLPGRLPRQIGPLAAMFVFAVGMAARSKLALYLAFVLARAHLL
jgi:hypothetical protein